MLGNRSRDTAPELALRRACHALGLRYRVDHPLPGMPRRRGDLVFTRARVAVFLDGCFWHRCPEHYRPPGTNPGFWDGKTARTAARDQDTDARLAGAGWTVVRVWAHEPVDRCAALVHRAVRGYDPPIIGPRS